MLLDFDKSFYGGYDDNKALFSEFYFLLFLEKEPTIMTFFMAMPAD